MAQDILVKVAIIVDLVDQLVDARCELGSNALEWLRADNLTVVDYELLIERGCLDISRSSRRGQDTYRISASPWSGQHQFL